MFSQVFSRLFQTKKQQVNELTPSEQYNGQAQIYAIPTVSSNFESRKPTTSTTNTKNNDNFQHCKK